MNGQFGFWKWFCLRAASEIVLMSLFFSLRFTLITCKSKELGLKFWGKTPSSRTWKQT